MLRYVSAHGISVLSSVSKPEYTAEDIAMFEFELTPADMAALGKLQHGKRTCPDCFTAECQSCASALIKLGCPIGKMPAWGRDNPNSASCVQCAAAHNSTATAACGAQYMVEKACGTAGGFPEGSGR